MSSTPTRRVRALIRDERRLSRTLQRADEQPFDADIHADLRERLDDMLETLDIIAVDDTFWAEFQQDALVQPDRREQLLARFDKDALRILLDWAGYHDPPPPAVNVIVDEIIADLNEALEDPSDYALLTGARQGLVRNLTRIRRQIEIELPVRANESILRSAARKTAQIARWLLPKALAVAAAALAVHYAPGLSDPTVQDAAKTIVESSLEAGATYTLRHLFGRGPGVQADFDLKMAIMRGVDSHVQAIARILNECDPSILTHMERRQKAGCIRRHFNRIEELLDDYLPRRDAQSNELLWNTIDVTSVRLEGLLDIFVSVAAGGALYNKSAASNFLVDYLYRLQNDIHSLPSPR